MVNKMTQQITVHPVDFVCPICEADFTNDFPRQLTSNPYRPYNLVCDCGTTLQLNVMVQVDYDPEAIPKDDLVDTLKDIVLTAAPKPAITIEIRDGCLAKVGGLPDGWDYELIDHDTEKVQHDIEQDAK